MTNLTHPLRLAVGSHTRGSGKGCAMNGCPRPVHSRGVCDAHRKGLAPLTEDDRWAKFVTPGEPDACWEWGGWRSPGGYGRFNIGGKQTTSSRAAAMRAGMGVPDGLDVCHVCDNPPCVNPTHLYVGTRSRNIQDCADRGRHPKQGLGQNDWTAKYTDTEVADWAARYATGQSYKAIARVYGAHPTTISRTIRGIQRKAVA